MKSFVRSLVLSGWLITKPINDISTSLPATNQKIFVKHHGDEEVSSYFRLAVYKRLEFELYNVKKDMDRLNNLARQPEFNSIEDELKQVLFSELRRTNDTRISETKFDTFDGYIRYSPMSIFPEPAIDSLSDYTEN